MEAGRAPGSGGEEADVSEHRYVVTLGDERKDVTLGGDGERWTLTVDGVAHSIERTVIEEGEIYSLIIGNRSYRVDLVEKNWESGRLAVAALGETVEMEVRDELEAVVESMAGASKNRGLFELKAPMPGVVVKSLAKAGDRIERGQSLLVLEAMKMQNELPSEMDGIVQEILVQDGQLVETGALLARVAGEEA